MKKKQTTANKMMNMISKSKGEIKKLGFLADKV
jgi:hypothetical protein